MKPTLFLVALMMALALPAAAADIPDRPEKLVFAPLQYEPPKAADYRAELLGGTVAYLVPDRALPLVNIVVYARVGHHVVPAGKEGLAELAGHLLTRGGTKTKTAEELEERLDFLAARLGSSIGEVSAQVSLNLLTKDLDEGLAILREVLTQPRFQDDKLELRRQQIHQSLKERNDDSANIEERERKLLAYGESFFGNRHITEASLKSITRADLETFHREWFHPANFLIAASGDFAPAEMKAKLERLLADWPFKGRTAPAVPSAATLAPAGVYLVDKDVNQGRVSILLPGLMRQDPDYVAAQVMNHILGGGGFTSRLVNRVRSDEGLAYATGSGLAPGIYYPGVFRAAFQTKSRTVAYATSIVIEEMGRIARADVTDEELETAKKSFIETFPRAFATKAQVAAAFADEELTGRYQSNPDWFKNYRRYFSAVTREDVRRVAGRLMDTNRVVILVVGQKREILKGDAAHPIALTNFAGGNLVDVPMRDPLTMRPLTP